MINTVSISQCPHDNKEHNVMLKLTLKSSQLDTLRRYWQAWCFDGRQPAVEKLVHSQVNKVLADHFGFVVSKWKGDSWEESSDFKWKVGHITLVGGRNERTLLERMFIRNKPVDVMIKFTVQNKVVNNIRATQLEVKPTPTLALLPKAKITRGHLSLVE